MRRISLLLAWSLAMALAPAALAAETGIAVTIGTGVGEKPAAEVGIQWEDGWFQEDAAAGCQELAVAAMALSGGAYAPAGGVPGIRDALKALGFGGVKSYNYLFSAAASDRTAYTFAHKTVKNREGKSVKLVAAVIRGTGSYTEWASNLSVGSGSVHEGFAGARDELLENLKKYLSGAAGGSGDAVKLLITGHSRGGAVANLAAACLADEGLARPENIYCYTFAAPAVSTEAAEEGYENIFNIIYPEDLVPCVPLSDWGYRRYGVDVLLPAGDSCGSLFEQVDRQYTALTGQSFACYQTPGAVGEVVSAIHRLVPSVDGVNMAMISALLSGDLEGLSALVERNSRAAVLMAHTALELSASLTPLLQLEKEALASAHSMAGYWCWLTAAAESDVWSFPGG